MNPKIAYVGAPLERKVSGVQEIPVLRIVYLDLSGLKKITGPVAFTSKRGVISLKMSGVSITGNRVYCIGEKTSNYLKELYHLGCDVPNIQNTKGLSSLLISKEKKVTLVGSDKTSKGLLNDLRDHGIAFDFVTAYRIEENEDADYSQLKFVDKILVGSSFSAEILVKRAGKMLSGREIYAIGNPTGEKLNEMNVKVKETFEAPSIENILLMLHTQT